MSSIKRIKVKHLEIGMYVTEKTSGLDDPGFRERGFIRRKDTIQNLVSRGIDEVYIDTDKGDDSFFSLPIIVEEIDLAPLVPWEEERERAEKIYATGLNTVKELLETASQGKAIHIAPVENLAGEISQSLRNNQNALLCLSQMREKSRYLMEHSMNCGLLMGLFSRHLGYDSDTVDLLTVGGLLHDIGKIRIPNEILNKAGGLNDAEWEEMKRHVQYGETILRQSEGISEETLAICTQHHERLNRAGYPHGLGPDQINVYGRMAAIIDTYDAITADRSYRPGISPFQAMRTLSTYSGKQLDKGLVYQFIRAMGVYPVGTLVELSNGRLGVVTEVQSHNASKPVVRVIYNLRHRHYEKVQTVDLSSPLVELSIVGTEDPKEFGINLPDFL